MEKLLATDSLASQSLAAATKGRWMLLASARARTRKAGSRVCASAGISARASETARTTARRTIAARKDLDGIAVAPISMKGEFLRLFTTNGPNTKGFREKY